MNKINPKSIFIFTFFVWSTNYTMDSQQKKFSAKNFLNGSFSIRRHDENSIRIINISPNIIPISHSSGDQVLLHPNSSLTIPALPNYIGYKAPLLLSIAETDVTVCLGDTLVIELERNNAHRLSIFKKQYHHSTATN